MAEVINNKKRVTGLAIAVGVLSIGIIGLGVAFGLTQSKVYAYSGQLENVYKKNMYDLTDSINNAETKLSKVLASNNEDIQNKLLLEVAHNAELATQSISNLPIAESDFLDTVKFINQVYGYTTTLSKKLVQGKKLTKEESDCLEKIRLNLVEMKSEINELVSSDQNYSILDNSIKLIDGTNNFSLKISKINNENIDYPTMIYDGPFSDSQINTTIKGLSGVEVSKDVAFENLKKNFENILEYEYQGETNGKIDTYNYKIKTQSNDILFVQLSKIQGNIITISGYPIEEGFDEISMSDGEKKAVEFAKNNGIENAVCVWKDSLKDSGYYNIAPIQNGVILYPDLVKVKIDLNKGTVIGYDAMSYFTNHTNRMIQKSTINEETARTKLPQKYNFEKGRLVLIPLEYSREVLCYEFKGQRNGDVYYFYINANTGIEENILKVVETQDGSKLM